MDILEEVQSHNFVGDAFRNIVSIRISQSLFDDLSDEPEDHSLAMDLEGAVKPAQYATYSNPLISRPFQEATYRNVIDYPFSHLQASRFSRGLFGVWYGALTLETTVRETAYHWYQFLKDSGDHRVPGVRVERRVHKVSCDSHFLDFRPLVARWPALVSDDYAFTHQIGEEVHRKQLPGLLNLSARDPSGEVVAVFTPEVLRNARDYCFLRYCLEEDDISVERTPGARLLSLSTREW